MGARRLQAADVLISPEIRKTLASLDVLTDADAAAAKLALHYGALIDEAKLPATYGDPLRYLAEHLAGDEQGLKHLRRIEAALSAHSVASDLGPKLLACLDALQATPRARVVAKDGSAARGGASGGEGRLAKLRAARIG